jgi:6-pyruvoyltetrahydropterin/6-carboxytetrahydropterin synthase
LHAIRRSIDLDFSHHIRGHSGACINLHGHTWKFEICVGAETLDDVGFVVDFGDLRERVLMPCHLLLDHALAVGAETYGEIHGELEGIGRKLLATRSSEQRLPETYRACGAETRYPGGLKVAVFPFSPTSERLAEWLYRLAEERLATERVRVVFSRVYETLHPIESVAEFRR